MSSIIAGEKATSNSDTNDNKESVLIKLHSKEGEQIYNEVNAEGKYIQPLIVQIFEKQKGNKNCGIQSCSLLMNAAYLGKADKQILGDELPFLEQKMFNYEETVRVKSQSDIESNGGLTLEEVYKLLKNHGKEVEMFSTASTNVETFRTKLKEALTSSKSQTGVIVNYHMGTLGQGLFFGHHSPLAAYYQVKDLVLLMDVWKHTHECWVPVSSLFKAMDTIDDASGEKRGFLIFRDK